MGELADFHFEIRYKPGKLNVDADMLLLCPLDINAHMYQCSDILSQEAVCNAWTGSRLAHQKHRMFTLYLKLKFCGHLY